MLLNMTENTGSFTGLQVQRNVLTGGEARWATSKVGNGMGYSPPQLTRGFGGLPHRGIGRSPGRN